MSVPNWIHYTDDGCYGASDPNGNIDDFNRANKGIWGNLTAYTGAESFGAGTGEHDRDGAHMSDMTSSLWTQEDGTFTGNGTSPRVISLSDSNLDIKFIRIWDGVQIYTFFASESNPTESAELLTNPSFTSATTGWSVSNCTIASVAGGKVGNGCQVTRTTHPFYVYQAISGLTIGVYYSINVWYKSNTTFWGTLKWGTSAGAGSSTGLSSSTSWTFNTTYQQATATTMYLSMYSTSTTPGNCMFDEASVKVTPITKSTSGVSPTNYITDISTTGQFTVGLNLNVSSDVYYYMAYGI